MPKPRCSRCGKATHKARRSVPVTIYDYSEGRREAGKYVPTIRNDNKTMWMFLCTQCGLQSKPGTVAKDGRLIVLIKPPGTESVEAELIPEGAVDNDA